MRNDIEVMANYATKKAKKIYLYRNGSEFDQAKCMVINDKQIRDFGTFLNQVTSDLCTTEPVRNIYTPSGGHRVNTMEEIQSDHYYVAGGNEEFKKIKYS